MGSSAQPSVRRLASASGAAADPFVATSADLERTPRRLPYLLLAGVMLLSFWIRMPQLHYGLPYLYDEDEAHHFNRIVRMLKSGDLNPHYFYKPALHFYLRLPVTALAFFRGVGAGELRELEDIKTRNRFGVAEYEFTVTHSVLVIYNRAFTLLLSLIATLLLFEIGMLIKRPDVGVLAALLFAVSPPVITLSTHIGVDMLMCTAVLLSSVLSLLYLQREKVWLLVLSAVVAGLAVASKYNAFPVALVPLAAAITGMIRRRRSVIEVPSTTLLLPLCGAASFVGLLVILGFLLGAPYSLLDLPAFLDGAAFEIRHYRNGNSVEPGVQQLMFYLGWLGNNALGWPVLALAALGAALGLKRVESRNVTLFLLLYPLIFFAYMCAQRVNYPRNMLSVIPFLCLAAAYGIGEVFRFLSLRFSSTARDLRRSSILRSIGFTLALLILVAPMLIPALEARANYAKASDSRDLLVNWFATNIPTSARVGIAGELQVPRAIRDRKGVQEFAYRKVAKGARSIDEFKKQGLSYLVVPGPVPPELNALVIQQFSGEPYPQRIPQNPAMAVLQLNRPTAANTGLNPQHIQRVK